VVQGLDSGFDALDAGFAGLVQDSVRQRMERAMGFQNELSGIRESFAKLKA
jgi:hypothetical protein